jgi:cytochrome c-type biogenesis protein CcmH/NrfG
VDALVLSSIVIVTLAIAAYVLAPLLMASATPGGWDPLTGVDKARELRVEQRELIERNLAEAERDAMEGRIDVEELNSARERLGKELAALAEQDRAQ